MNESQKANLKNEIRQNLSNLIDEICQKIDSGNVPVGLMYNFATGLYRVNLLVQRPTGISRN